MFTNFTEKIYILHEVTFVAQVIVVTATNKVYDLVPSKKAHQSNILFT